MAPGQPAYVITLVHGTFSPDAEWTHEESLLSRELHAALGGSLVIKRFPWDGKNSYTAREMAGKNLHAFLNALADEYPGARQVVVAHSHGGNIALYALNEPLLAQKIAGVTTLATPFLVGAPTNLLFHFPILIYGALVGALIALLNAVVVPLVVRGLEYSHSLDWWKEIAVYGGVLWLGYAAGSIMTAVVSDVARSLTEYVLEAAGRAQQVLLSRLATSQAAAVPLLALRFRGDEAKLLLSLQAMAAAPSAFLFRLAGYVFLVTFVFAVLMIAADIISEFVMYFSRSFIPIWPWTLTTEIYWMCYAVLGLTFVSALVLAKLLRAHSLGFGREDVLTPMLVRIVVRELPENFDRVTIHRYSLFAAWQDLIRRRGFPGMLKPHLVHSWLYEHGPAIRDVCTWIERLPHPTQRRTGAGVSGTP